MTEIVSEGKAILSSLFDSPSSDISCPSPPACLETECHNDLKNGEQQKLCNQVQPKKRAKAKVKLIRSMAVCEDSPPCEETQASPQTDISSTCQVSDNEGDQESSDPKENSPSKESSREYTDSTGIDLHQFIIDTLNNNPRDRMMLLKLEQDMIDFIVSNGPCKKFPHMSSYHRMLVHRVAAYFGMEHNVDQSGKSVIINQTRNTRIPEQRFVDKVHKDKTEEIRQWKAILRRDNSSDDQNRLHSLREKQNKSIEERQEDYLRARERIFNKEAFCSQKSSKAETRDLEECNPYAETQRKRQLFRGSRDSSGSSWTGSSRQSSTETDCRYSNDPRPWSSTDSDSSYQWTSPAPKARQPASHSWDARGSGSISLYRLPPSCPHASPPPILEETTPSSTYATENGILPGSILLNPLTGQPFLNPDGSPAVYNPPDSQQPIIRQTQQQSPCLQPPPQHQVLQYSSVSYAAPQMLPVAPTQPYSTIDDVSAQFAHVTVGCQSAGDAPPLYPPNQSYFYAAPPPNPPGYCQPSPQVPVYFYGPTSSQNGCRPVSPAPSIHNPAVQSAGVYSPVVRVQQPLLTQPPTVMAAYPTANPHQCSMVQSKVMTGGFADTGQCCMVPAPSHHGSCHPPDCANLSASSWHPQY